MTKKSLTFLLALSLFGASHAARAATPEAASFLSQAQQFYGSGQYFRAARYAFAASEADTSTSAEAYAWITLGLVKAGLPNAASYFFVRTLQTGQKPAIQRVLTVTQDLLDHVGADILRKYLIRHTTYDDYNSVNRNAYLYSLGKDALLAGDAPRAVGYFNGIRPGTSLWPYVLELRGSAQAISEKNDAALADFKSCQERATAIYSTFEGDLARKNQLKRESDDLRARCIAGEARTLYQMERFEDADRVYDRISKYSFVWPDILFEQAWNSFGRMEYNRTLGKLVSYKSPALSFVFNSEIDVLRAQSYLALCLYSDSNDVINEFNKKYTKPGEQVKNFVEKNQGNLEAFYQAGKGSLRDSLYTENQFNHFLNRFVRGPYFQNLVALEKEIAGESSAAKRLAAQQGGVSGRGAGFPGFLEQVLSWRYKTVHLLGGNFVKNSMVDYYNTLVSDYEKIAFIKLEMLKRAKDKLLYKNPVVEDRMRGNVKPSRRDDQYYWSFNGEFWNDELGDYVFGLESECSHG